MTIDINELRQLTQAVSGWSNCNQAWLDQSEDVPAAVVGHIDEDGNTYPIATIDCDQYYAANQSLPLAKFYAAANPASVSELLDRLETAEKEIALKERVIDALGSELNAVANERDTLRAKIEQMERQEPVGTLHDDGCFVWRETAPHQSNYAGWKMALYALPGAQNVPDFADAYQGAMEEVAIWKKRALEAEDLNRKFIAEINGPTYMGEPEQPAPSVPAGWKLVPLEPTPGMIDAAEYVDWGDADVRGSCINAWGRMLAAAPKSNRAP